MATPTAPTTATTSATPPAAAASLTRVAHSADTPGEASILCILAMIIDWASRHRTVGLSLVHVVYTEPN